MSDKHRDECEPPADCPITPEGVKELHGRVSTIEEALRGDMRGNPGIMQNLIRVMNEIYTNGTGLKGRMQSVENWQLQQESRAQGAAFVTKFFHTLFGGIVVAGLAYVWERLKKP